MAKLPRITARKLLKLLKKEGFSIDHVTGSHYILFNPHSGKRVTIPYHTNDLPVGTVHAILKQANILIKK